MFDTPTLISRVFSNVTWNQDKILVSLLIYNDVRLDMVTILCAITILIPAVYQGVVDIWRCTERGSTRDKI